MVSLNFYQNVLRAHSNILTEAIPVAATYPVNIYMYFLVKNYE